MEQLLTYGLYIDNLKHISEVENGLACNCVCPNCKYPLIAKNNPLNKKVGHFAHHSGKECEGAIETALHLLAKSILLKTKKLNTPKYHFDYDPTNEESIFKPSQDLSFENIFLEKPVDINGEKIIPDAIGELNGKQVYIEFANTHFIDDNKKTKLKNSGVACIEIDLKGQLLDEISLTNFLNSDSPLKYWITNPKFDKAFREFKQQQKIELAQRKDNEEQERIENENKIIKYKNSKQFKIYKASDWGDVFSCPLKKIELQKFKSSKFYRHSVLQRIIDGEPWNGEIYGRIPNGRYIFLKNQRIFIYPPDNVSVTDSEIRNNKFFHAGLMEVLTTIRNSKFGECKNCEYFVDNYYIADRNYNVCKQSTCNEIKGSN